MSTEAVMGPVDPDEDPQTCRMEGCGKPAVYHVLKVMDDSEQEKFFCEAHGQEYATRAHLVISTTI